MKLEKAHKRLIELGWNYLPDGTWEWDEEAQMDLQVLGFNGICYTKDSEGRQENVWIDVNLYALDLKTNLNLNEFYAELLLQYVKELKK
jgi:hypothetical protein